MKSQLKASDLRIGNFINYQGKLIQVEGVVNRTIYHSGRQFDQIGVENYVTFEPIPLTEEWLVRFGFQIDDDLGDQIYYQIPEQKYGYGICFDHDDITFYKFNGNGGENVHTLIYDEKHFQYVHQLQNLYYALTQTELIIKQ